MFRLSNLIKYAYAKNSTGNQSHIIKPDNTQCAHGTGPVVIWNLTKACNLSCMHCYASSFAGKFEGEIAGDDALRVVGNLHDAGVKFLILSGGEPLLRQDLSSIAEYAKQLGMHVSLSTNGTLINNSMIDNIVSAGFDYVGVSLDGARDTHDKFRGMKGAYDKSVKGVSILKNEGIKTGVRFTLTQFNIDDLKHIISLVEENEVEKLYLSHLVYSGRGNNNKSEDISHIRTRQMMEYVFGKAESYIDTNTPIEIVTGNNEADGAFLTMWLMEKNPSAAIKLLDRLERSGGNSAGIGIANIDSQGDVHPDPLIQYVNLGNVKERPFADIWNSTDNDILNDLRQRPRKIKGRCGSCRWMKACGGANRERAWRMTGDFWASDPACYLTDVETRVETACAV